MAKRRSHKKKSHYKKSKKSTKRPVGFVKARGKFRLAFRASRNARGKNIIKARNGQKFRVGKGFKTKTALARHFVKKYGRR